MILNSNISEFVKITLNELASIIDAPYNDSGVDFNIENDDLMEEYYEDETAGLEYECILFKDELRIVSIDDNTNIIETVKWVGSSYTQIIGLLVMNSLEQFGEVKHSHTW